MNFQPYSTWALGDTLTHGGGWNPHALTSSLQNEANISPGWLDLISIKDFGL